MIITILFFSILIISPVLAAPGDYIPLVKVPGINANAGLFSYLSGLYSFLISIVGILAMAVLVYGGVRYITSAGNTASIDEARESINSAIAGLILALVSWLIFATINKDILVLKNPGIGLPSEHYGFGNIAICTDSPGSGTQNDPCKCIDNPKKPIFPTAAYYSAFPNPPGVVGGDCNKICSDANYASDSKYHCIKADIRIGRGFFQTCENRLNLKSISNIQACEYVSWDPTFSVSLYPIEKYVVAVNDQTCSYVTTVSGFSTSGDPLCNGRQISGSLGDTLCGVRPGHEMIVSLIITDSKKNTNADSTAVFTVTGWPSLTGCLFD